MNLLSTLVRSGILFFFALLLPLSVYAQAWPTKQTIKFIVVYPAGGASDVTARMIGAKLSESIGQSVVIENKPGANGIIATEYVAKAPPDGYTLLMANLGPNAINPVVYKKLPYDAVKDFSAITLTTIVPQFIVVAPTQPINSIADLITYSKANPGKVNFGSAGSGTSHHLSGELFKQQAGIDAQHIPYKGSAPALMGLMRGDIQILIANIPSLKPAIDGKQIKPLAITSLERSSQLPEYKTANESGLPGFEVIVWYGLFAPSGTPEVIINKLNTELRKITSMNDVRKKLNEEGADAINATPKEFSQRILRDFETWKKVVESSGARAD